MLCARRPKTLVVHNLRTPSLVLTDRRDADRVQGEGWRPVNVPRRSRRAKVSANCVLQSFVDPLNSFSHQVTTDSSGWFSHSLQSNGRGNTFVTRSRHVTSRKRRLNSTCKYMCFHWVFNSAHRATKKMIDYEERDSWCPCGCTEPTLGDPLPTTLP